MKKLIFLIFVGILVMSCSTLGFSSQQPVGDSQNAAQQGKIEFSYKAPGANSVALAGDFNNWDTQANQMQKKDGIWKTSINLEPGKYQYKFVIDGDKWVTDPNNPNTVDDGYGGQNSIITVGNKSSAKPSPANQPDKVGKDGVTFTYTAPNANSVALAGDFNDWKAEADMMEKKNGVWQITLDLQPGEYQYKFVVDGDKWVTDPNNPNKADDGYGGQNSVINVGKSQAIQKPQATQKDVETRKVTFTYEPLTGGKKEVYVAGDFNNWNETANKMQENNGIYETTLELPLGKYEYKFIVDGKWQTDEKAEEFVSDTFGGQNSVVFVGDKNKLSALRRVEFTYVPQKTVKEVYLAGSFNAWNQKANKLEKNEDGSYSTTLLLKPDEYSYKFVVNGTDWVTDPNADKYEDDGFGGKNSIIVVDDRFPIVTLEENDGEMLTYGIPTEQNLQTVNPLTDTRIEFKTKTHSGDVVKVLLWKDGNELEMSAIATDGSFDYFRKVIELASADQEFDYCFIYEDGSERFYMLQGGITKEFDKTKLFRYSQENVEPFFTPDWVKTGIIYQIFMDRFYNGDKSNDQDFQEWYYDGVRTPPPPGQKLKPDQAYYHLVEDWYDISGLTSNPLHPEGKPDWWSFYGGDVAGIREKLGYLTDLGITIIYFNPVFEAKSNHKYDAADYMKVDPHFGTNEEFKQLVKEAHEKGIKVILDVAFNHTGETFWAFQDSKEKGPDSQYYDWYEWKKWPLPEQGNYKPSDYYECWWGFGEMPNLNYDLSRANSEENSVKNIENAEPNWEVVNYILGLADFWIGEMGLDGFRLDVPNEVPFWFWKLFRERVKSFKPDAYLVGEIWSNAVDWVNNEYFDAVMNYAYFKDPVMRFFNMRNCSAKTFDRDLKPGRLSYPTQASQVMMNLIDSHDTYRYLESANGNIDKLKMAVLFQMTYVGAPHIWYGDEIGMMGAHDPDCRRPFNWKYTQSKEKVALRNYYQKLIDIRKNNKELTFGNFQTLLTDGMVYAYKRSYQGKDVIVVINNDTKAHTVRLETEMTDKVWKDLLSRRAYNMQAGKLVIEIPAMSGVILK